MWTIVACFQGPMDAKSVPAQLKGSTYKGRSRLALRPCPFGRGRCNPLGEQRVQRRCAVRAPDEPTLHRRDRRRCVRHFGRDDGRVARRRGDAGARLQHGRRRLDGIRRGGFDGRDRSGRRGGDGIARRALHQRNDQELLSGERRLLHHHPGDIDGDLRGERRMLRRLRRPLRIERRLPDGPGVLLDAGIGRLRPDVRRVVRGELHGTRKDAALRSERPPRRLPQRRDVLRDDVPRGILRVQLVVVERSDLRSPRAPHRIWLQNAL